MTTFKTLSKAPSKSTNKQTIQMENIQLSPNHFFLKTYPRIYPAHKVSRTKIKKSRTANKNSLNYCKTESQIEILLTSMLNSSKNMISTKRNSFKGTTTFSNSKENKSSTNDQNQRKNIKEQFNKLIHFSIFFFPLLN